MVAIKDDNGNWFISIHALRGEGDRNRPAGCLPRSISIHALRGEGDLIQTSRKFRDKLFLSTPSVGRATARCPESPGPGSISIHALRGEGDLLGSGYRRARQISIHALRGEGDDYL